MSIAQRCMRSWALDVAIEALQAGGPVLAVDDLNGTGIDMIVLARSASTPVVAEMIREGSGFICVTVSRSDAHRLCLPPMVWEGGNSFGGRMCVAVDAAEGVTTGISAQDRAVTLRTLGDGQSTPTSLTRPGHVIPVLATDENTPGRPRLIAEAGHLCAVSGTDVQGSPVAFASLVSRIDPCREAGVAEVHHWDLPTIRYSDLRASITDSRTAVA
ncbi:3,4-dihydroxy-2-butanone-4-phosphate synthase [Rhodococcus artemisiae]|uniref:3,4-dihydroxy-2-butanone-4-phosphate synthase n=1 Tax=Rhodococcus artemisiae TaxID=714159 RepID=A0ABU7LGP1_9NOCA|nr:3,4-dihydroxy-2-butanone-4-phosphate synthase [Rhodococcus artemisiae]MEE2060721.1 3,4-dihydroxy-2-butanone-4-phosphate synthase [Rhodococcus artemisiae]